MLLLLLVCLAAGQSQRDKLLVDLMLVGLDSPETSNVKTDVVAPAVTPPTLYAADVADAAELPVPTSMNTAAIFPAPALSAGLPDNCSVVPASASTSSSSLLHWLYGSAMVVLWLVSLLWGYCLRTAHNAAAVGNPVSDDAEAERLGGSAGSLSLD